MSVDSAGTGERTRTPLSRGQVLRAAVRYVDEHGLDALSMHKLGAALGVAAMSLYKHVANKDDLLDGMVDGLWTEIPIEPATTEWQQAVRELAGSLRDVVHRHPHAAPLLTSRQVLPEHALRVCDAHLRVMREGAVPEQCAVGLLRTTVTYGIGYALAELSCFQPQVDAADDELARLRRITALLPAHASDDLVRTALLMCGDCDMATQFEIGIDLMIRGLDAYLRETVSQAGDAAPPSRH